jgi:hypothetical protein
VTRLVWIAALLLLAAPSASVAQARLDVTQFLVLGEGLAAGVQDFGLRKEYQERSFPALVAEQMGTILPLPLMQGPSVVVMPGVQRLPAILPNTRQTTVRDDFTPSLFVFNLAVPGLKMAEAISRRPAEPLVRSQDPQQTIINLILGYPSLVLGRGKPLWSQLEYAEMMRPTVVIVCLGYAEAVDAAASGEAQRMPSAAEVRSSMTTILSRLRRTFAEVIVMNIPDPFDTGYFTSLQSAPRYVGASPGTLTGLYGIQSGDWITPSGLMAIGNQLLLDQPGAVPPGGVVGAEAAAQVRARVQSANAEIASVAQQNGAVLYDLSALIRQVRTNGVVVGTRVLTADYLGGFYSLNGFYPGTVGHALIANGVLDLINRRYGTSFASVDPVSALANDPALRRVQTFRKPRPEPEWETE